MHAYIYIYIYISTCTWNPNDQCFDWKRPSFGGFKPQNRGRSQVPYIYIHIVEKPFFSHRSILKPWLSRCLRTTNQLLSGNRGCTFQSRKLYYTFNQAGNRVTLKSQINLIATITRSWRKHIFQTPNNAN